MVQACLFYLLPQQEVSWVPRCGLWWLSALPPLSLLTGKSREAFFCLFWKFLLQGGCGILGRCEGVPSQHGQRESRSSWSWGRLPSSWTLNIRWIKSKTREMGQFPIAQCIFWQTNLGNKAIFPGAWFHIALQHCRLDRLGGASQVFANYRYGWHFYFHFPGQKIYPSRRMVELLKTWLQKMSTGRNSLLGPLSAWARLDLSKKIESAKIHSFSGVWGLHNPRLPSNVLCDRHLFTLDCLCPVVRSNLGLPCW